MALMNRWEVSNFLDSRKGRDWIPDFVGERFDFGGLSTAVNMDNGLGKSSCTEAVLWMLSRDRELGRKTRSRIAPDSDGRFTHIRCEFVEPKGADLFAHGERITGERWVFGYYGNRGEDCFYCYPGTLEDVPVHIDEIDEDGGLYKVCIPDEEFRASLAQFKNAVVTSAREWAARVRQFMSGAQLEQLVAYQKKGGGDKAASFYDVKVGRGEAFDEAFFRQYVAPEILVGVGDFEDDVDARGFDRKIVAQAQSVIDAKIQVQAKGETIAKGETNLAALRAVNEAAEVVIAAERHFAEQAQQTSLAVTVTRATAESWGVATLPTRIEGVLDEIDRQAITHGGWEIGGGPVISQEWLDNHIGGLKLAQVKMIDGGVFRVLPLSVHPIVQRVRTNPVRYVRFDELLDRLRDQASKPEITKMIARVEAIADGVRRHGNNGLRRLHLTAADAFNQAQAAVLDLEAERNRLHGERGTLMDQMTKFEANEAAFARMSGSGLFSEAELAAPLTAQAAAEAAHRKAKEAVEAHFRRVAALEQTKQHYDKVVGEFGLSDDLRAVLDDLSEALKMAVTESDSAQSQYAEAKRLVEALRQDEEIARRVQNAARQAMEEFAAKANDMRTFQGRFGTDADPALESERLLEARSAAQKAEAAREAEARAAAATLSGLDRESGQVAAEQTRVTARIAELDGLAPHLRAFEGAHPGRSAETFLAEETQRQRDGEALAKAAEQRRSRFADLVAVLDRFEAVNPGVSPADWLAEAERRRAQATLDLADVNRQITKAKTDLAALKACRVAPTETDDAAAAVIADLAHRPLHAVIVEQAPVDRRADLLDHFSSVLFAPVFADVALAEQAARLLAEAGLPVPVLVEADLARWMDGGIDLITRRSTAEGDVVTGLFTGIRTSTVEAILDPEALARRLAETEAKLTALEEQHAKLRALVDDLAPEGEACRAARRAAEAQAEDARLQLAKAEEDAETAAAMIASAQANLTAAVRSLVEGALRFLRAGGDDALSDARDQAETARQRLLELGEAITEATRVQGEADGHLAEARRVARAAEAEAAQWLPWCDKAKAFIAEGGGAELDRRRRAQGLAEDAYAKLAGRITAAAMEADRLEGIKDRMGEARCGHEARMERWKEPLQAAAAFVEKGEREELAGAAETLRGLKATENHEEARLRFDFEAAANFVEGGGAAGMEPAKLRFEALKARLEAIDGCDLRKATARCSKAENWHRAVQKAFATVEQRVAAILFAYQMVVGGSFDGTPLAAEADLAEFKAVAARLTDAAIAPDAPHGVDSLEAIVAGYDELAERIGAFDLDRLREGIKEAASQRQLARSQYQTVINREVDPNRRLDSAIQHKLESAREKPQEVPALLATVESGLAWERTLHAKAVEGLTKVQEELVSILRSIAGNADVNLRRLKKVLAGGDGAKIHINVSVATDEQIGSVLERTIDDIETERTRFLEDQAKGRNVSEEQFASKLTSSVRETVYQRMFVKGGDNDPLITIEHPTMREGRPFRFEKDGISGGQATALTLLWTIKLAEFSVVRETASMSPATRRRAGSAQHSIVIVDGLFSDLSKQELIDESMEAMQGIKGSFQLIGLIHSPHYRNNWERFPTLILGKKVASVDDRGRKSEAVAIEGQRLVRGRVMALTYGASDGAAA